MFRYETVQNSSVKIMGRLLRVAVIPALMVALNVGCSSEGQDSQVQPSTNGTPNPPPNPSQVASIFISCPGQVQAGGSGTCTATLTGTISTYYWLLNGEKVPGSDDLLTVAWANAGEAGTHKIQAVGKDSSGMNVFSNMVTVVVVAPPGTPASIFITCPSNVLTHGTASCSSVIRGNIVSGTWMVDGFAQPAEGGSLRSYTWFDIATPGTYVIQLVGKTADGMTVASNMVSVVVSAPVITPTKPSLTIMCPLTVAFGGSPTCTATVTGTVVSGYWMVNDLKVPDSDNQYAYTWYDVRTAGTYKVQAFATAADGSTVSSNVLMVTVQPQ